MQPQQLIMQPQQWLKLEAIFAETENMEPSAQLAYVEKASEGDTWLKSKLLDMLKVANESNFTIEEGIARATSPFVDKGEVAVGDKLDKFRLLKKLGFGGMGDVFLAEREDNEFKQEVAIKIIRHGYHHERVKALFHRERQILAELNHPNICRLYDGGTTESGITYIVMEHIEGVPLDDYLQKNILSTSEKLKLIIAICDAVQSAHQNLIVHCDIKPKNILITKEGQPKLLDFGIARLLSMELDAEKHHDQNQGAFSYQYASPELLLGKPPHASSDVFSIGILLYEMLTGEHPQHLQETTLEKVKQYHRQERAMSPSEAVERATAIQLDALPNKPLRLIFEKSTRYKSEERYQSVDALQDDIERYLTNYPIQALRTSPIIRTLYWFRRNPIVFGGLLVITLLMSLWFVRESSLRAEAVNEAQKSRQVTNFFIDLFMQASPSINKGKQLTVKELVETGTKKILEDNLNESTEAKLHLLWTLRDVNVRLGHYDIAKTLAEKTLALQLTWKPEDRNALVSMYSALGSDYLYEDKYDEAAIWYEKAIALIETHPIPTDIAFGTLRDYSQVLRSQKEYEQAMHYLNKAIKLVKNDKEGIDYAYGLATKGLMLDAVGKTEEALNLYAIVLPIYEKHGGKESYGYISQLKNYGSMLGELKRSEEALEILKEALVLSMKIHPDGHPYVGNHAGGLANVYQDLGDYVASEKYNLLALENYEKFNRSRSTQYLYTLENLGYLYEDWDQLDKSRDFFERALALATEIIPFDKAEIADINHSLARVSIELVDFEAALTHARTALAIYEANNNQMRIKNCYMFLGMIALGQNRLTEAQKWLEQGTQQPTRVISSLIYYGYLTRWALANHQYDNALAHIDRALAIQSKLKPMHPITLKTRLFKVKILLAGGRVDEARALFSKIDNAILRLYPNNSRLYRQTRELKKTLLSND